MHPDQEALLATVVAHPDDDLPRLVYADWLEEHARTAADAARAGFIRAQIAEYRSPEAWELVGTPRPSSEALRLHRDAWLVDVPKKQRPWVGFERGFPGSLTPVKVRTGYLPLLEKPPAELRTVRRLVIPDGNGMQVRDYARLAESPGFARVSELHLGELLTGPVVASLLASPHAARLEMLACERTVSDARAVLAAPAPALRRLRLPAGDILVRDGVEFDPADVERSSALRGVNDLELYAWGAADAFAAICRGAGPAGLVRFVLPSAGSEHVAALDRPELRRLTVQLAYRPLGHAESVADALARHPRLGRLEALTLTRPVGLAAFARLAESPALAGLKRLDAEVAGDQAALTDYLLNTDAPLRFEKLCVGRAFFTPARAARLHARYGPKLQLHSDLRLEPALRRLGRW